MIPCVTAIHLEFETSTGIVRFAPGDVFTPKGIEPLARLIGQEKVKPAHPCHICHEYAWWLTIHDVLICGVCHPPVPGTVKKWIGDLDRLAQLKADKTGVILSWEEIRERKAARDRSKLVEGGSV